MTASKEYSYEVNQPYLHIGFHGYRKLTYFGLKFGAGFGEPSRTPLTTIPSSTPGTLFTVCACMPACQRWMSRELKLKKISCDILFISRDILQICKCKQDVSCCLVNKLFPKTARPKENWINCWSLFFWEIESRVIRHVSGTNYLAKAAG